MLQEAKNLPSTCIKRKKWEMEREGTNNMSLTRFEANVDLVREWKDVYHLSSIQIQIQIKFKFKCSLQHEEANNKHSIEIISKNDILVLGTVIIEQWLL